MSINENIIELKIFDFDTDHRFISDLLGLNPTRTWTKGEEYFIGNKRNKIKKTRKENYWVYNSINVSNDWIGYQIDKFLEDIIVPRKEAIKRITEQFHTEFSIVQYIYDSCNPGLYFDKKAIKILNECGLELNIDLYVLTEADKD
ncbi:MAG: hypothetical protein COW65_00685 [Cytophagales bacterium CG18_big_fil_WC_8_21_14_2_50_42_9]|nr:MAG: hypothetical protein COW65_00685 [Cytophagales bacterium CG18_big_fil_WC_8_21_14_2_50_42_9]